MTMVPELGPIPAIPDGLREAALLGRLVIFVGAGVSMLAGCPGWDSFANGIFSQLIAKSKFTYSQLEQVKSLNPRIKLSIATALASDTKTVIDYESLLHSGPRSAHKNGRRIYSSLFRLGNIFVTTNYDRWLDDRITEPTLSATPAETPETSSLGVSMRSIFKVEDFLPAALTQPNTVIHLHGSLADPAGMILTTQDYIRHYANDHHTGNPSSENRVLTFLEHLFANYTVLFVGYGLSEFEILEYVILKAQNAAGNSNNEARHYSLQGFFSHEETLLQGMTTYYLRQCGIQLIPFERDHKDHGQLADVLEDFAQRIPVSKQFLSHQEQLLETLALNMEPLA